MTRYGTGGGTAKSRWRSETRWQFDESYDRTAFVSVLLDSLAPVVYPDARGKRGNGRDAGNVLFLLSRPGNWESNPRSRAAASSVRLAWMYIGTASSARQNLGFCLRRKPPILTRTSPPRCDGEGSRERWFLCEWKCLKTQRGAVSKDTEW